MLLLWLWHISSTKEVFITWNVFKKTRKLTKKTLLTNFLTARYLRSINLRMQPFQHPALVFMTRIWVRGRRAILVQKARDLRRCWNKKEAQSECSIFSFSLLAQVMLARLESVKSLLHGRQLIDVILKLLSHAIKLKVNRQYLAKPQLNTLNILLGSLNLVRKITNACVLHKTTTWTIAMCEQSFGWSIVSIPAGGEGHGPRPPLFPGRRLLPLFNFEFCLNGFKQHN